MSTDVSLVDEDTNSILADDTNRAIPGNLEMQVVPPGDQIWIRSKWRHLEATFCGVHLVTCASGSFWWPSLRILTNFQDFDKISGF